MLPTDSRKERTLSHWGELKLIEKIGQWLGVTSPPSPEGMGDDAAVVENPALQSIITIDSLVYGKHFTEEAPAETIGAKLLKRSISDLAAMGAKPQYAILACLLPPDTSVDWLQAVYSGLKETAEKYEIKIVGGDVTSTHRDIAFSLTLTGYSDAIRPLTRKSGLPGDNLFVTGDLGGSSAGKHLHFEPRLSEGIWLASRCDVTSAIDISDGLGIDLLHLVPVDCSIGLDAAKIPISQAAIDISSISGKSPLWHAFNDGEDYELLFTVQSDLEKERFVQDWQKEFNTAVTCIGRLELSGKNKGGDVQLTSSSSKEELLGGYEHFRST